MVKEERGSIRTVYPLCPVVSYNPSYDPTVGINSVQGVMCQLIINYSCYARSARPEIQAVAAWA